MDSVLAFAILHAVGKSWEELGTVTAAAGVGHPSEAADDNSNAPFKTCFSAVNCTPTEYVSLLTPMGNFHSQW